ncbi:hypothetical protein Trydic_g19100 [Trypoxylus dichotomus]
MLEQYLTEIKKMAMKCKLGNLQEDLNKTVLICGVNNTSIPEKQLQLVKIVEKCTLLEISRERNESIAGCFAGSSIDAARRDKTKKLEQKDSIPGHHRKATTQKDEAKVLNSFKICT